MEINFDDKHMKYIAITITTIFILIVLKKETSITIAVTTAGMIILIIAIIMKMQRDGIIRNTKTIETQIRNYYARKRVKNPKLKRLTEDDIRKGKERKQKVKINW